jgi:major membrane immunogen (membrane-anchored lipoprotein)
MKRYLNVLLVLLVVFVLTGCEKVNEGKYKEGTYFGSYQYESYGKKYVTTAVVYIDDAGLIKSVFIDSTYFKNDVYTTKKVLGDDYGMKEASAKNGVIEGGAEWYEQINVFEDKVVEEQGLDWLTFTDEAKTKTDAVSGVTITVDTYNAAVKAALDQAKK